MVYEKVVSMITDLNGAEPETLTQDMALTDLNLDSLDIAELLMNIEDEFGISVEDKENLKTIGDVVSFIEQKSNA